jgi:hypothetical protein
MSAASNTAEDRPASLEIRPAAPWRVLAVEVLSDYSLKVRFVDGLEGVVDMRRMTLSTNAGVFETLRDPMVFAQARIELGVVTWPGELDLAPDAMYDEIKAHGTWVLD